MGVKRLLCNPYNPGARIWPLVKGGKKKDKFKSQSWRILPGHQNYSHNHVKKKKKRYYVIAHSEYLDSKM